MKGEKRDDETSAMLSLDQLNDIDCRRAFWWEALVGAGTCS